MGAEEKEFTIAEIMAAIEEKISKHYGAYAAKFPQHREFWEIISAEEIEHAMWIRDLYAKSQEGRVSFNEKRFDRQSLLEFHKKLDSMLGTFEAKAKTHNDALKNSISLESLLLEKEYFTVFDSDFPELKDVLKRLAVATQNHRLMLEHALKGLK